MNWKSLALRLLRNLAGLTLLSTLVLGLFGFLLAGVPGMVNLAIWGALLGLVGGLSTGLALLINAHYWSSFAGRFGAAWLKMETEGDFPTPEPGDAPSPGRDPRW